MNVLTDNRNNLYTWGANGIGQFMNPNLLQYEYDKFGRRERGVMAHEVEKVIPEAVTVHESGYKMVNYTMIGKE